MKSKTLYVESSRATVCDVGGAQVQFLASEVPFREPSLDVILGTLPAGVFVPLHSHSGPEWFFLLEGEMEAYEGDKDGGDWRAVHKGELAVIPAGVRHAWRNRSSAPARVFSFGGSNIFAVMRSVATSAQQAGAGAPPTTEFVQLLDTVAAETGNWIASPEENAAIGLTL